MLKIENLTVRYGEKVAVNNLSLHISKGEIYGFIGHNGAGKTTTIKAATGIQYLDFIADIFGISSETRVERINKYADIFELRNDLGSAISSYSHGMKQKLAIISALIHNPKLIIMDEPFVGLDPKASHHLKQIMRELCDDGGAIFFSTHVLDTAEKLCDKVAIIKGGQLVKTGTMEEVKGDESLESVFLELEGENTRETVGKFQTVEKNQTTDGTESK